MVSVAALKETDIRRRELRSGKAQDGKKFKLRNERNG